MFYLLKSSEDWRSSNQSVASSSTPPPYIEENPSPRIGLSVRSTSPGLSVSRPAGPGRGRAIYPYFELEGTQESVGVVR